MHQMDGPRTEILKKLDRAKLNNPVAVVGLPGIAMVGKGAVLSIAESLKAEKVALIFYHDFPAQVAVGTNGKLHVPRSTIYFWKNPKGANDLFIISGDFQPTTSLGIFVFSDYISNFCKSHGVKTIVSTGAYVTDNISSEPSIFVSSTSRELLDVFTKHEQCKVMSEGVIMGANGIIPAWGKAKYGIDGVCLLAETMPILAADPKASRAIVEILGKWFNVGIDMSALDKQIVTMERAFEKLRGRLDKRIPEGSDRQSYIS